MSIKLAADFDATDDIVSTPTRRRGKEMCVWCCVGSSEVAKRIREDSHALVFGLNTLASLLLQSLLTAAVAGKGGFELGIRMQFLTYGCYFLCIGAAFLIFAAATFIAAWLRNRKGGR